ncbi:hypothetical protein AAFF_G00310720 [Aldrovandia affinis]|uniref:Uncharacterized protein n=1 Tax=Aldrovandia affinis TaxID=143900 RepID=A0AAD7R7P8_9TELE|nr:hypothetical protein AAFF_G00310720 [Aldrovandia affinis]
MKKFRKVLDGLTTSSPVNVGGAPPCSSTAGTPTAVATPREIEVQETLVSENFQICKAGSPEPPGSGHRPLCTPVPPIPPDPSARH